HDSYDLVEVPDSGLDLSEQVDGAGARRLLAILDRYRATQLAFGDKLAVATKADLAGDEQQGTGPHEPDIIGNRRGRCGQDDAEIREFLLHLRHDVLLRLVACSTVSAGQCRRFEVPTVVAANSVRNFKSKSGTRSIGLLVPLCFRSSCQSGLRSITNFGSGALVPPI